MGLITIEGRQIIQAMIMFGSKADAAAFGKSTLPDVTAARGAPGCADFTIGQDIVDPRIVRIYQNWDSEAQWKDHRPGALAWKTEGLAVERVLAEVYTPQYGLGALNLNSGDDIETMTEKEKAAASGVPKMMQVVQVYLRFGSDADVARHMAYAPDPIALTWKEPGVIEYGWSRDFNDTRIIRLSERWCDQAHMYDHIKAPHAVAHVNFLRTFDPVPSGETPDTGGGVFCYVEPHQKRELTLAML